MSLTAAAFLAYYPQFQLFAGGAVLPEVLRQANARFCDFDEDTDEARRLFTAHRLTLYAAACLPEGASPSMAMIADAGQGSRNKVASKKVGEVSVTYSDASRASSSFSTSLKDLAETIYGLQLLSLLRLHSRSVYVP